MRDVLTQHSFAPLKLKTVFELLIAALVSNLGAFPGSRSQFAAPISMEPVKRIMLSAPAIPIHFLRSQSWIRVYWPIRNRGISFP
ncbi:hypothetical protein CEXT_458451 [Caerostris extrusa]|uniref:Uncharacterized protein n=1 Tax=Caerostris extrusa TaxID=172846 RepID=A0AAV4R312_CAEEX|nr:hypothetical protein CEXT_458451 [Caerostris extrusa]